MKVSLLALCSYENETISPTENEREGTIELMGTVRIFSSGLKIIRVNKIS